jgi:ABC-2 type transport system ATP-binding protein
MAAIELDGLSKRYGEDVTALRGIDLEVQQGEIFGFLGPNGAGKSTTINILLDFVRPTSGSARVLGLDAQADSQDVRRRTGVLPEGYTVYDRLTGRHHVEFVIESKDADDDPNAILERVGISDAADRKAGGYSKGMRQRLTLGMALVGDPDLLILDEPSTGLDPSGVQDVREIVSEEADRGTTVFFSSHILSQVEAVCDRVGILREGELVAVDTVEGLREASGTEARLRISVGEYDAEDVAAVRSLDGVSEVQQGEGQLIVAVADGAKTKVLTTLENRGVSVSDFETEEVSLEELFMSYTEGAA